MGLPFTHSTFPWCPVRFHPTLGAPGVSLEWDPPWERGGWPGKLCRALKAVGETLSGGIPGILLLVTSRGQLDPFRAGKL